MKFFISSVISGFEDYRHAVKRAVEALGHSVIRAEDFESHPESPRVACLQGVRDADAVLLVLGERYGYTQASGISATHEEFLEAKEKHIFLFIQGDVSPDEKQKKLINDAQDWVSGTYSVSFTSPDVLNDAVIRAIRNWEKQFDNQKIDFDRLVQLASGNLFTEGRRSYSQPTLSVSFACGPERNVIRPSILESDEFKKEIEKIAYMGSSPVFSTKYGTKTKIRSHSIHLAQENYAFLEIWGDGSVALQLPLDDAGDFGSRIIGSEVKQNLKLAFGFVVELLESLDPTHSLSHVAFVARINNSEHAGWAETVEEANSSNSYTIRMGDEVSNVMLSPPAVLRTVLSKERDKICEDLVALLRRQIKGAQK